MSATPIRPVLCGMCGIPCGIPCGIKSLIHKAVRYVRYQTLTCGRARVGGRAPRRAGARTCTGAGIPHIPHIPHTPCESSTYAIRHTAHGTAHTAHPTHLLLEKKDVMKKEAIDPGAGAAPVRAVIRCTPENAGEMRALVQRWPELHALVQQLQAAQLFPGLRSLQISLTGAPQWVAQGLGAPLPENAPQPRQTTAKD